jgi:enolase
MQVTDFRLRGILDSRAAITVEAELVLDDRFAGRGSTPRAIAPGRRERPRGPQVRLGPLGTAGLGPTLRGRPLTGQRELDDLLMGLDLGSDVTLAVSLAYARAAAQADGQTLRTYLGRQAGGPPAMPQLLVNVFSGGIHGGAAPDGFQQVMLIPATGTLAGDIEAGLAVFEAAERLVGDRFGPPRISASSGLLVPVGSEEQLRLLSAAVAAAGCGEIVSFGVDVAAEHLVVGPGRYRFGPDQLTSAELAKRLTALSAAFPLTYLEDPFDSADEDAWRTLRGVLSPTVTVVGDDLFATDARRVDSTLADGILLKPSQPGNLTATLDAATTARDAGLVSAVSHRSGETEDTAMCDLAVAVAARLIKVGGPRRGDRLAKYNQLLRLAEELAEEPIGGNRS